MTELAIIILKIVYLAVLYVALFYILRSVLSSMQKQRIMLSALLLAVVLVYYTFDRVYNFLVSNNLVIRLQPDRRRPPPPGPGPFPHVPPPPGHNESIYYSNKNQNSETASKSSSEQQYASQQYY